MFNFWPFVTRYGQLTEAMDMCASKAKWHKAQAQMFATNSNRQCGHLLCASENEAMYSYIKGLRDGFEHGKLMG